MQSEEKEGYDAYWKGQGKGSNPYPWTNQTWWQVEDWEKRWKQAED